MPEKKKTETTPKKRGTPISKVVVNYWKTKLHAATIGIKKDLEYRSKSPQFTKEYEVRGEIYFNDDKEGKTITNQIVALNLNDFEKPALERRLMIRTFTGLDDEGGGRFIGGIEHSMLESINLSNVVGKPVPVFILHIQGYEYLIRVVRERTITTNRFTFCLLPDDDEKMVHFIEIVGKVGFGDDFNIMENSVKIGEIDDRKLDIGGKYDITITQEKYQYHKSFVQMIIMFCCALKYLDEVEKDTGQMWEKMKKEKNPLENSFIPITQELDLFKNPRRIK
jgi:hypothetical protein